MGSGEWSAYYPVGLAVLFYFALLGAGMLAAKRAAMRRVAIDRSERRPYA